MCAAADVDVISVLAVFMVVACAIEMIKVRKELEKQTRILEDLSKKSR